MQTKTQFGLKAALAALIAVGMCAAFCLAQPGQAQAAQVDKTLTAQAPATLVTQDTKAFNYTLGKTVSGSTVSGTYHDYTFSLSADADVNIIVKNTGTSSDDYFYAELQDQNGSEIWESSSISAGQKEKGSRIFLAKGTYKVQIQPRSSTWVYSYPISLVEYKANYKIKVAKIKPKVKLGATSGKLKIGTDKEVTFTISSSDAYAEKNLKIAKNTNPKVATAEFELGDGGVGTLKITPKKMGTTKIKVKLGSSTATYTANVTNTIAYVAKGTTTKLEKPIGVSKAKYSLTKKSAKKKVATVTSGGKVTAKKQGRAMVVAKKGKVSYTYNVVVTDYKKLGRETYQWIEEYVPDPDTVKINYSYKGYYKINGIKVPVVYIDYSYGNETGGMTRSKIVSWYDDALDVQTQGVLTANNVIKKQTIKI